MSWIVEATAWLHQVFQDVDFAGEDNDSVCSRQFPTGEERAEAVSTAADHVDEESRRLGTTAALLTAPSLVGPKGEVKDVAACGAPPAAPLSHKANKEEAKTAGQAKEETGRLATTKALPPSQSPEPLIRRHKVSAPKPHGEDSTGVRHSLGKRQTDGEKEEETRVRPRSRTRAKTVTAMTDVRGTVRESGKAGTKGRHSRVSTLPPWLRELRTRIWMELRRLRVGRKTTGSIRCGPSTLGYPRVTARATTARRGRKQECPLRRQGPSWRQTMEALGSAVKAEQLVSHVLRKGISALRKETSLLKKPTTGRRGAETAEAERQAQAKAQSFWRATQLRVSAKTPLSRAQNLTGTVRNASTSQQCQQSPKSTRSLSVPTLARGDGGIHGRRKFVTAAVKKARS
eukprot:TRINITY_DN29530_c0_g1_i1.p2 TRINITY_DN29530_c0_g1~~TRINITY_DN29530_c0_g1_i1.p2  ORF type:complete len:401 (-),score=69.34 TRINITY_DN29530_c0_g1_i1:270-1472(-)